MSGRHRPSELSYEARARLADNLFLLRRRAGYSQAVLDARALIAIGRVSAFERGHVAAMLDTYVRLAGALSVSLDDPLDGVAWTPAVVESEIEGGYIVEFEIEPPAGDQ